MTSRLPTSDSILAAVADETGLRDYGDQDDPGFRARVAAMLENLRGRGLSRESEDAAIGVFRWLLTARLGLFADHPGVADETIAAPLIATGEPRSGTTLLHALLAEDPASRPVRFWEVFYPSPPPGRARDDDPRIERANGDWREILDLIPGWLVSHPYNDMLGMGLPECERLWAIDFRSASPSAWWRVPAIGFAAGLPQDPVRQYQLHRMTLQQLQHAAPPRRWALKGTSHHVRLAALLDTYPDACVVWIHRDPVVTTASFQELIAQIFEGIAGQVDRVALAAGNLAGIRQRIDTLMADPLTDDPRILHLRYPVVARDPIAAIRNAYAHFGIAFDAAYEERLKTWLGKNRADRYGSFSYSTDALGVDLDTLYEEFAPYMDRFGLAREARS